MVYRVTSNTRRGRGVTGRRRRRRRTSRSTNNRQRNQSGPKTRRLRVRIKRPRLKTKLSRRKTRRARRSSPTAGLWSVKQVQAAEKASAIKKASVTKKASATNPFSAKLKGIEKKKRKKKERPKQCFLCDDPECKEWKKCKTFETHRPNSTDPTKKQLLKDVTLESDGNFPASVFEKDILPKMRISRKKRLKFANRSARKSARKSPRKSPRKSATKPT